MTCRCNILWFVVHNYGCDILWENGFCVIYIYVYIWNACVDGMQKTKKNLSLCRGQRPRPSAKKGPLPRAQAIALGKDFLEKNPDNFFFVRKKKKKYSSYDITMQSEWPKHQTQLAKAVGKKYAMLFYWYISFKESLFAILYRETISRSEHCIPYRDDEDQIHSKSVATC